MFMTAQVALTQSTKSNELEWLLLLGTLYLCMHQWAMPFSAGHQAAARSLADTMQTASSSCTCMGYHCQGNTVHIYRACREIQTNKYPLDGCVSLGHQALKVGVQYQETMNIIMEFCCYR
jgi:hypothetical protein